MEVKEIRKLLDALASSDVNELTLETGEYKLTVKRGKEGAPVATASTAVAQPAPAAPQQAAPQPQAAAEAAPAPAPEPSSNFVEVTAPIVGTFYAAPSPDADAYVKVGDRVERGAVLCIIEAMKLMNEIEAETAGTVKEILVRNEEPVEYGQVLFRIDPA
ncbi:MAG TPA: acetyl-CoA carboxylase biotin carboxyl carrier protein [Trueperaceae bacterium]